LISQEQYDEQTVEAIGKRWSSKQHAVWINYCVCSFYIVYQFTARSALELPDFYFIFFFSGEFNWKS
jgi:hypothetical protein